MTMERSQRDENTYDNEESSLDLEFFIDLLVFNRIVPQLLIKVAALRCFDYTGREELQRKTIGLVAGSHQMP